MPKVRVGVFGLYHGLNIISQPISNPDAELVAVCDRFEPVLEITEKLAADLGIEAVERTGLIYAYAEEGCCMKAPSELRRAS